MDAGSHDPGDSAAPVLLPKHTIFLSHSGQQKAFVQELNQALLRVHHSPFFDQNKESLPIGEGFPKRIFKAAQQCRVAVIVLSRGYLTSKWPMLELVEFHKSMKKGKEITLLPLFYKCTPDQIESPEWTDAWVELFKQDEELVKKCKDAVHELKGINGLIFKKYGDDHVKYKEDVVDEICRLLPRSLPFATSDIQGCHRLCKHVSELFKEHNGVHYLGLYGIRGLGKSRLSQAMCNKYFGDYKGKYCIVKLEDVKAADSEEKRKERLNFAIKQLVGSNKNMSEFSSIEEGQKYLVDRVPHQCVFVVVENVSHSSLKEAEFYVRARYAHGSRVLVTSRSRSFLEKVLGGRQYSDFCQPIPGLDDKEAAQLVLANIAPRTLLKDPDDHKYKSISNYCAYFSHAEGYHPSSLIALGSYLHQQTRVADKYSKSDELSIVLSFIIKMRPWLILKSFQESIEAGVMYSQVLVEYNTLSSTAKLIFLDLALCYGSKFYSNGTFNRARLWNECNNLSDAISYISHLHKLGPKRAQTEVEKLQEKSFLKESSTENLVPYFYYLFARWLLDAGDVDREEKKWFVVCRKERDDEGWLIPMTWPDVSVKTVTRVILIQPFIYQYKIDKVMEKLQQFTSLVHLELVQVDNLRKLDLRGLSSLRVMKVKHCENLKEIGCNCASWIRKSRCYQKDDNGTSSCLNDLEYVQLIDLLSLKVVSFAWHCSNLESLMILDCPKVVQVLYRLPWRELKSLVCPRVGISPSNSAREDLKEWFSDYGTGQFSN